MAYSPPDPFVFRVFGGYDPPTPLLLIEGNPIPEGDGQVSDRIPSITATAEITKLNYGRVEQPVSVSGYAVNTIPPIECVGDWQGKKCDLSAVGENEINVGAIIPPLEAIHGSASTSIMAFGHIQPARDRVSGYSVYVPYNQVGDGVIRTPADTVAGVATTAGVFTGRISEKTPTVSGSAWTSGLLSGYGRFRPQRCRVAAQATITTLATAGVRERPPTINAQVTILAVAAGVIEAPTCRIAARVRNAGSATLQFTDVQPVAGTVNSTLSGVLSFSRGTPGSGTTVAAPEPTALTFSR